MTVRMIPDLQARLSLASGMAIIIDHITAVSAGAASDTYAIDARREGAPWPLIFQRSPTGPMEGTLDKLSLARLQAQMFAHGLPVARVIATTQDLPLGPGFIMERLPGESLPQRYLRDDHFAPARGKLTAQVAKMMAQLHALPLDSVADVPLVSAAPLEQVRQLDALMRKIAAPVPVFDLAVRWLMTHAPTSTRRALVHGDLRSGNLLVDPDTGLVAVLDWELAHIGDPQEDIGWICVNSWRFGHWQKPVGGFGLRADFYAAYEAAGGAPVDRRAAQFWEIYGTLRWGVSCLQLVHQHLIGAIPSVERAAIGRRVSEVEIDLLELIEHGTL
jgi:aminoglycoside phosphotransferase (APT) family kinase protein